jgi:hypothetical protein
MNAERPGLYLPETDEERDDTQEGIRIRIRKRTNYNIATIITTKRQTIKRKWQDRQCNDQ